MKPVNHVQWSNNLATGWVFLRLNDVYETGYEAPACIFWLNNFYGGVDFGTVQSNSWGQSVPKPDDKFMSLWDKCRPTMATRANLSVFLYELRDIKKMFELLPKKHFNLRDWKQVFRYVNGQHLNWNFGWKPFISDVRSVMKGLTTFEERLFRFLRNAGANLIKHGAEPAISSSGNSSSASIAGNYALLHSHVSWTQSVQYRATFEFRYVMPPLSYESLRWRAYLDTLGLAANAANIWEIIPWSFVWDWFVDVGSFLDTYSEDWLQPWVYFCQACCSAQKECTYNAGLHWKEGTTVYQSVDVTRVKYKSYARITGLPSSSLAASGALSSDKIRLLTSLVAGRLI